jgi:hypothetical protein
MKKKVLSLFTLFVINQSVNAAIVYTNMADIQMSSGVTAAINMDNSGSAEYSFTNDFGSPYIMFGLNNHLGTVSLNEWDVIKGFDLNTVINASTGFYDQGDGGVNPGWEQTYTFPSSVDKYLACKFNIGASTYFGWIRVQLNGTTLTFKDYAYNNSANTAINAGDMGSSVVLVSSITVSGNANATTISTMGGTLQMAAVVLPSDATNATYTWTVQNGTGTASINSTGLLTAISNGTITVTATANDASGASGTKIITISNQSNGVDELANQLFSIYPNPVINELTIENRSDLSIKAIEIYSLNGEKIIPLHMTLHKIHHTLKPDIRKK